MCSVHAWLLEGLLNERATVTDSIEADIIVHWHWKPSGCNAVESAQLHCAVH